LLGEQRGLEHVAVSLGEVDWVNDRAVEGLTEDVPATHLLLRDRGDVEPKIEVRSVDRLPDLTVGVLDRGRVLFSSVPRHRGDDAVEIVDVLGRRLTVDVGQVVHGCAERRVRAWIQ
jgi:hypothetical protein